MNIHIENIFPRQAMQASCAQHIFLRCELDQEPSFAPHIKPMLFAPAPALSFSSYNNLKFYEELLLDHVKAAHRLKNLGFRTCVLAADNDGVLQKILSPRFNNLDFEERISLLITIYEALKLVFKDTWVLITLEELAPGGFDATDGVMIAQRLESLGLENLIISSGTRDFLPLYNPRPTKQKDPEENFNVSEPALACACWLLPKSQLKIWCLGFIRNTNSALKIAQELGLAGLILKQD